MPELPLTVNTVVTRIDAPFPEQWREGMYEFTKEIAAIKELLGVLSVSQTESKEAQQALSELYTKQSVAERASQAIIEEQPRHRVTNERGEPVGASQGGEPEAFHSPSPPPGSPYHEEEQPPKRPRRENPSRPPEEDDEEDILDREITMPQHYGGKYTAQDLLILAGKAARAEKPVVGSQEGLAARFAKGAKQVPNIEAGWNLLKTYSGAARQTAEGFQNYSTSLGFQPGEGFGIGPFSTNSLDLGPLGTFRTPLSSGVLSGAKSKFDAFTTAMSVPGLSTGDAMTIQQMLAEKGWFPDEPQTDELFDAQTKLFSRGGVLQELATNPDVFEMMDKSLRSGSASVKEITELVEEIPDAAKNAHVGMTQMVADMKAFGELSESQGGTRFGGSQQAIELAAATGMPASASMGLLDNPWTQSMIFRETGMPSWMQGALPGSVKNAGANKAFWEAARAVGRPKGYTYKDINGGESTVSGVSQQAAMMKQLPGFENMSTEQIERRLRGGQQFATSLQERTEILGALGNWRKDARGMIQKGITGDKLDRWISGGEEGQMPGGFGHLLSTMLDQRTPDGRHRYSREDIKRIREAGQGLHGEDLVQAKYSAVKDIIESKANKQADNQTNESSVTIDLSPAARKFLQLPNKKSQQKLNTNAGSGEPVNHAYTGATDPLMPGVSTNQYSSRYLGQ